MKFCKKCGETKPTCEFYKWSRSRDGLQSHCKACQLANVAAWREANPDKARAKASKWYAENADKARAKAAEWYAANLDKARAKASKWRAANPDKVEANNAKRGAENPEKAKARTAKWYAENPEKARANNAKRRARKLRATPAWADTSAIAALYAACPSGYHVDHVVPLKGKKVCGLHVHNNLQYLTAGENMRKGAKHPVE